MKKILIYSSILIVMASLFACKTIPEKATAVTNFDVEKYMGKWYEIARLDFKHERNLNNTQANYSLNNDGTVRVVNTGYNYKKEKNTTAKGKAKFVGDKSVAKLKVSFFGPFYSGYNVIALDKDYMFALVAGKNLKYLWILSRQKTIPENVKQDYLRIAKEVGYNTDDLIWVKHD